MTPRPISTTVPAAPTSKKQIDLHEALRSTLRVWLTLRDSIVWSIVSGAETPGLDDYDSGAISTQVLATLTQMNVVRLQAFSFAEQMVTVRGRGPSDLIAEVVEELLQEESPKFLLRVDTHPGSF